ncbi:MAG: ATP synthase F1 subunit epsilon [Myxococcota bacterium]
MTLQLSIVTPDEEALDMSCEEVVAPGIDGELGLMAGHIPLVSVLRPGVLVARNGGDAKVFAVGTGYVEIDEDKVIVLTEVCERPDEIDEKAEADRMAEVEKKLADKGPADPEFLRLSRTLELARSRIEARRRA